MGSFKDLVKNIFPVKFEHLKIFNKKNERKMSLNMLNSTAKFLCSFGFTLNWKQFKLKGS